MYNGIGVQTARGTGTSGHVMKNVSALKPQRLDVRQVKASKDSTSTSKDADPGILHHNEIRQLEVILAGLRTRLEDDGLDEESIDEVIHAKREELKGGVFESVSGADVFPDTHSATIARKFRNDRIGTALNLAEKDSCTDVSETWHSKKLSSESSMRRRSRSRSIDYD